MYEDFDVLLPGHLAAERVAVSRQLLNHWRTSGRLQPAEIRDGKPLYRLGDVLRAESSARAARPRTRSRILAAPAA